MARVIFETRTITDALQGKPFERSEKVLFAPLALLVVAYIKLLGPGRDYERATLLPGGERKGEMILIRKQALHKDSWTGGDYTQYIAHRDDGSLQPCKGSMIPLVLLMIGFVLLELVGLSVFLTPVMVDNAPPITNWNYVYTLTLVGFMSFGVGAGLLVGEYRLMKAVQWRSYDGKRHSYYEPKPGTEVSRG